MTDHKFTDEQIIKGLSNCNDKGSCDECPFDGVRFDGEIDCASLMHENALALINRQKASLQEVITLNSKLEAENAKLQRLLDFYEETSGNKKARTEAIKEFAWRLKSRLTPYPEAPFCEMVGSLDIDALVKEMTEDR